LLARGAKVNVRCGKNHDTPLHMASKQNDTRIVRILLDHGADHKAINLDLKTPLAAATQEVKDACFLNRELSSVLTMNDFNKKQSTLFSSVKQGIKSNFISQTK
jgi:ankyrin repeat protein